MHELNPADAQRIDRREDRPLYVGLHRPYIPKGCDQQGRYPEAAHAASEIEDLEPRRQNVIEGAGLLLSAGIVGAIVVIVLAVHYLTAA